MPAAANTRRPRRRAGRNRGSPFVTGRSSAQTTRPRPVARAPGRPRLRPTLTVDLAAHRIAPGRRFSGHDRGPHANSAKLAPIRTIGLPPKSLWWRTAVRRHPDELRVLPPRLAEPTATAASSCPVPRALRRRRRPLPTGGFPQGLAATADGARRLARRARPTPGYVPMFEPASDRRYSRTQSTAPSPRLLAGSAWAL